MQLKKPTDGPLKSWRNAGQVIQRMGTINQTQKRRTNMKTIRINNVNFEVIRPRNNDNYMYTRNNILACHGKG